MAAIIHVEIGVCGLSCRLCPSYHRETKSRCPGCKSEYRMGAPCPFLTCAVKKKGIEFCWLCSEKESCVRLKKNREFAKDHDTSTCYQKNADNAEFMQEKGVEEFEKHQKIKEILLKQMLGEFNDGRSKSRYCAAATVMEIEELEKTLNEARKKSENMDIKQKAEIMHSLLDEVASKKNYILQLRK